MVSIDSWYSGMQPGYNILNMNQHSTPKTEINVPWILLHESHGKLRESYTLYTCHPDISVYLGLQSLPDGN